MKLSEDQEGALNEARFKLQRALRLVDGLLDDDSFDEDELESDLQEALNYCDKAQEALQEARIQ